jgi:hypothetical protein
MNAKIVITGEQMHKNSVSESRKMILDQLAHASNLHGCEKYKTGDLSRDDTNILAKYNALNEDISYLRALRSKIDNRLTTLETEFTKLSIGLLINN